MSNKGETRLRDKAGRVFLDSKMLEGRKGFERFKIGDGTEDFEEVVDKTVTPKKAPKGKAAAKKTEAKEKPAEKPSADKEDVLAGWEE